MYAMKLLALGAATAFFFVGEADAMKLLVKKGYGQGWDHDAYGPPDPAPSVRPPTSGGGVATKAKTTAGAGALKSRVASYFKTFKNPSERAHDENVNLVVNLVLLVCLVVLVCFLVIIFAAATGSTSDVGPNEGTPDELVKRDFNDGAETGHNNGLFMTEYVDTDGNRADFEEVNVYVYDSQSAYDNARGNYGEVGADLLVGIDENGFTRIDGANGGEGIDVFHGGTFGGEGIDVNYHRDVGSGWENYATRNLANTYVNAY